MGSHYSILRLARSRRQQQQPQQEYTNDSYPTTPTKPSQFLEEASSNASTLHLGRRNKLQKMPERLSTRRISFLDIGLPLRRRTADGSVVSFDSAPASLPLQTADAEHADGASAGGDDCTGLGRRLTVTTTRYGTSESGLDDVTDNAMTGSDDVGKVLRRKSLLLAAPPGTISRRPLRNRRYTMPATTEQALDLVLEQVDSRDDSVERCLTPSGISVIGAFKRGSLRITNGAASPCPSSAPNSPTFRLEVLGVVEDEDVAMMELEEEETGISITVEDIDVCRSEELERPPSRLPPLPPVAPMSPMEHTFRPVTPPNIHDSFTAAEDTPKSAASTTIRQIDEDEDEDYYDTPQYPPVSIHYHELPPPTTTTDARRLAEAQLNGASLNFDSYNPPRPKPITQEFYTFEESVITRRKISREFIRADIREQEVIASDYTVSSTKVTVRRPVHQAKSLAVLAPTKNHWEVELGPGSPKFSKMSGDIPLDSKITGQSYYRRFERRKSQMAMARGVGR